MFGWIASLFHGTPDKSARVPEPKRAPSRRTVERAMCVLAEEIHDLRTFAGPCWKRIPPVGSFPKIMGWGFLEGRNEALVVDARLAVCLFDDDIDVTSVCVLIDGTPSIEIERRLRRTTIRILEGGTPFVDAVLRRDAIPFDTYADHEALPPAVVAVMDAVLAKVDEIGRRRDALPSAADLILSYGNA